MFSFLFFRWGFQEKIGPRWRNYLIRTGDWEGEHNTPLNTLNIFISAIAAMQVIFWTEDNFCFISDRRNLFNCKLKKIINEQLTIFYSPSNTLCCSHKSVQIKIFSIILSLVCVPFSHGSTCKYWISVTEDILCLKQIE